jgi:hypothetical protein
MKKQIIIEYNENEEIINLISKKEKDKYVVVRVLQNAIKLIAKTND